MIGSYNISGRKIYSELVNGGKTKFGSELEQLENEFDAAYSLQLGLLNKLGTGRLTGEKGCKFIVLIYAWSTRAKKKK